MAQTCLSFSEPCFPQVLVIVSHVKMEQLVIVLIMFSTHAHAYLDILEWIVGRLLILALHINPAKIRPLVIVSVRQSTFATAQ